MEKIHIGVAGVEVREVPQDEAHTVLAAISRSPVFCVLPPASYAKILAYVRLAQVRAGLTLVRKGERPSALFMVVRGGLLVSGERERAGPGRVFGLTPSSRAAAPAEATIRMAADGVLAVITADRLKSLVAEFPQLDSDEL